LILSPKLFVLLTPKPEEDEYALGKVIIAGSATTRTRSVTKEVIEITVIGENLLLLWVNI
jgi:hypothetical protein